MIKKKFRQIGVFDFTSFFWPGLFKIFWPTVDDDVINTLDFSPTDAEVIDVEMMIPKAQEYYGWTPMNLAAQNGHKEIVKFLANTVNVENSSIIIPNTFGKTPIHMASINGHADIVKILTKYTDNPNTPDKIGITPFQYAKENGHKKVVKILKPYTNNNPTFIMDCSTIFLMILIAFGAIPLIGLVIGLFYIAYFNPQFALFFYPFVILFILVSIVKDCLW